MVIHFCQEIFSYATLGVLSLNLGGFYSNVELLGLLHMIICYKDS